MQSLRREPKGFSQQSSDGENVRITMKQHLYTYLPAPAYAKLKTNNLLQ